MGRVHRIGLGTWGVIGFINSIRLLYLFNQTALEGRQSTVQRMEKLRNENK